MIKAEIIKDSVNNTGNRLTSWVLTYPRIVHQEVMTHRMFSRNAASSRAIPVQKMIDAVVNNPAFPEYWGANQKGMQAETELTGENLETAKRLWLEGRDRAVEVVRKMTDINLHKQIANRLLEPWAHMTILLTASEYGNFFSLRAHQAAQPEFQALAYRMLDLYQKSTPERLCCGEWHIPFGDRMEPGLPLETRLKVAVARAARVSYLTFENQIDVAEDIKLFDRLREGGHLSPFEHVAYAAPGTGQTGNFVGWVQFRKIIANENRSDPRVPRPSPHAELTPKPV